MKVILEIKGHSVVISEENNEIRVEFMKDDETVDEYSFEIDETEEVSTEGGSEDKFKTQSQEEKSQDDESQDDEDGMDLKESKSVLGKSLNRFFKENKF